MLNGISLFSGYAGIDLALSEYVRPILYCDIEKYTQGIMLSRMDDESTPFAPIWNDVTTLDGTKFRGLVDVVYGGFPCQDISVAGLGKGLEGERSGLFFEIVRLAKEISPSLLVLENVPAIRSRGDDVVQKTLAELGYDTRWTTLSAAEVGANHKRERWFCVAAHAERFQLRDESWWRKWQDGKNKAIARDDGKKRSMANTEIINDGFSFPGEGERQIQQSRVCCIKENVSHSMCKGLEGQRESERVQQEQPTTYSRGDDTNSFSERFLQRPRESLQPEIQKTVGQDTDNLRFKRVASDSSWWSIEPDVGRVANGVAFRVDRIKALGNGVVPLQVKTAFETLMGISL